MGQLIRSGGGYSIGTELPTCGVCVERHKVMCLITRVAALRIGKDCAVESISCGKLLASAVPNGRCEAALMVIGSVSSSGGGDV
jgi:hypothetical protein